MPDWQHRKRIALPKHAPGRDGPRELSQISFHSLRHTATSLMKNAGINASVVMDIIGHESEAISAHYTHIDEDTKRKAIALLPAIPGGRK